MFRYITIELSLQRTHEGEDVHISQWFRCSVRTLLESDDLLKQLSEATSEILSQFEEYIGMGSGWRFEEILQIHIASAKYSPIRGSSYIPLPKSLQSRNRFLVNVENKNDHKCLLWSVIAQLHPPPPETLNKRRINNYTPYEDRVNVSGMCWPAGPKDIDVFESNNVNFSINVYGVKNKSGNIYPLRMTKFQNRVLFQLLYIKNKAGNGHYVLIRDFNAFMRNGSTRSAHFCNYCLHNFRCERTLLEHNRLCVKNEAQRVNLPTADKSILKYENFHLSYMQILKVC